MTEVKKYVGAELVRLTDDLFKSRQTEDKNKQKEIEIRIRAFMDVLKKIQDEEPKIDEPIDDFDLSPLTEDDIQFL